MRSQALEKLEEKLEDLAPGAAPTGSSTLSTGRPTLDRLLPGGGLPRGRVTEWRGTRSCGKTALLRSVLLHVAGEGEPVALVDVDRTLYAPDWLAFTGAAAPFWIVRPGDAREAAWCADLLLRSRAFGAVALVPRDASEGRWGGGVVTRLQRLAGDAGATFVVADGIPVAGLRLRFRPGRMEPVRGVPFGPRLPPVRPLWARVKDRRWEEVPVLCPTPAASVREGRRARDQKGRR